MNKHVYKPESAEFVSPDGSSIFDRFSYSAAVRAGDLLFVAGQVGLNPDGTIPEDADTQAARAFERMKAILEHAGSSMDNLVELVSYHVNISEDLAGFVKIKERFVPAPYPTWTILEVAGLARKELVIEIKATALAG